MVIINWYHPVCYILGWIQGIILLYFDSLWPYTVLGITFILLSFSSGSWQAQQGLGYPSNCAAISSFQDLKTNKGRRDGVNCIWHADPFTPEEVQAAAGTLKYGNTTGINGFLAQLWKYKELKECLLPELNTALCSCLLNIHHLSKGEASIPENYKSIS